ncbi:hypothetical protein RJ640_021405 [Escallonia rubra]|uniref:Uncharacterized protein n=1 Tax=Escallonia rubra TaxID=112253 RepID=A0AA88UAR1_9ASTE|nr:hypothetical protein RJ640_021405 [Escallonia rubra]
MSRTSSSGQGWPPAQGQKFLIKVPAGENGHQGVDDVCAALADFLVHAASNANYTYQNREEIKPTRRRGAIVLSKAQLNEALVQSLAEGIAAKAMVLDGIISSPHRRTQNPFSSPSFRKPHPRGDELGSCSTLLQRHRFLLTALVLLTFLCTIYLYFAVTLGANESCSELTGTKKALCRMEQAKISVAKGKLKVF